jgi:hypothetical protein
MRLETVWLSSRRRTGLLVQVQERLAVLHLRWPWH